MWRYRALLPIDEQRVRFPLPIGGTPLRAAAALRSRLGLPRLWLKDETAGAISSNKDRATALVLEIGLRSGASTITTSSTGNAGVATAWGAATVGLSAAIFTPADCDPEKVAVMRAAGAHVFRVARGYRAAFDLSRAAAREFGWLDRNTGANPVTIEAKKTVAFEIWEQLERHLPDVVVAPVGDGPTLVGLAKGFHELRACGMTSTVPRIIGVQAEGCQPLVRQWRGLPPRPPETVRTIADGIRVPVPAVGEQAVRAVTDSAGAFVAVSDDELRSAMAYLANDAATASEPAGAAALAGARRAMWKSFVDAGETVVALVTGKPFHGGAFSGRPGSEALISGDLDEFREVWRQVRAHHLEHFVP
ncbi:threonine synthase [Micromonospora orduensis]|nr:pyridoxal-phosphate dependent enzyme [Micromonospora orduensis]